MGTDVAPRRRRLRIELAAGIGVLTLLLAVIIVPPLVNIGRYKARIAEVISASLGRPVRLSSVELRLFPRPGFVLTDLTVDEDPAYGAEPLLHANTVMASIRFASLWRGLEISRISVDEASLNLVRMPAGRWNLEALFRTAAKPPATTAGSPQKRPMPLPYLEATNSRINIKNGVEKLPYSLINSEVSFWQDDPGEWRIRLRGQPARTDVSLQMADTGIVRLEANIHRAPELRQVPMHIDVEWSEAQLGQLARLLVGSDPGWRGDLSGELHLDGTLETAQIKTRLRASGVHRAEFAPVAAMDFDATCALVYHYSTRAVDALDCNSPLGDGRIRLAGALPADAPPKFSIELDRLPVAAALDALRTVRSGIAPQLVAAGTVSGKISYAEVATPVARATVRVVRTRAAHAKPTVPSPLTGSFTVQGFELSGEGIKEPVRLNKVVLEPEPIPAGQPPNSISSSIHALVATATVPAGAATPLTVTSRLTLAGYQISAHGLASIPRVRELADFSGVGDRAALGALTGEAATVDLGAEGPWIPPDLVAGVTAKPAALPDKLSGTLTLHDAHWKADFLANPIAIAQATLRIGDSKIDWDPVAFSYGPVKGTAILSAPLRCDKPEGCPPSFQLQFGSLDAGELEAAILGAREKGTLISALIARLSPSKTPAWPQLEGTIKADSLILGPVTLSKPSANIRILPDGAEITSLETEILGGKLHGSGTIHAPSAAGNQNGKPTYSLEGQFQQLNPAAVGKLLGQRWAGGAIKGNGKIELAGYSGADFAASASGKLHFDWTHGSVQPPATAAESQDPPEVALPPMLARFDTWTADATIAKGVIQLDQNQLARGAKQAAVNASASFGTPATVKFSAATDAQTAKR